jgi:lipoprotein NlpI
MLASLALFAAMPASAVTLLEFARERQQERDRERMPAADTSSLRETTHELERANPPPDAECAASLGATRFAQLHAAVGIERGLLGDFAGAARAYRRAHACRPRDVDVLAALAGALFDGRAYADARVAVDTALAIDPRAVNVNRLAGNLDYVEERWADAVARFRYVASSDPDRNQAGYGQLMYFLAQMRAGVKEPRFVTRTPGEGWPQPLLLYLQGAYTEDELVYQVKRGDDDDNTQPNTSTDERLCEALFYVGEAYWARGEPQVARDYFTALVNLKVVYFLEHGLALAEIAKLRE